MGKEVGRVRITKNLDIVVQVLDKGGWVDIRKFRRTSEGGFYLREGVNFPPEFVDDVIDILDSISSPTLRITKLEEG